MFLPLLSVSLLFLAQTVAQTLVCSASADTTLYESADGSLSNGSGQYLFSGRTAMTADNRRRAVIVFQGLNRKIIPEEATVENVVLSLFMSKSIVGPRTVELHRVLRRWGESGSDATGPEGGGAAALEGDASWLHTFYPDGLWDSPGGDFVTGISASQTVDGTGSYRWESTAAGNQLMVADVQTWLDHADQNFGWILLTGESLEQVSAKRFYSRHNVDNPPRLTVSLSVPAVAEATIWRDDFESGCVLIDQ